MAPGAVQEGAQRVEGANRPQGKGADFGVGCVQVRQQCGSGGQDGQRPDGLAGDERIGDSVWNYGQQPERGDASGRMGGPRQRPPFMSASPFRSDVAG